MSRRITAGNDVPFRWAVKLQGQPFDLSGKDVKVYVINSRGEIPVARLTIEGNEVSGVFEGRYQTRLGEHSLVLRVNEGRPEMKTATVADVFELVQWSADAGGSDEGDVIVAPVLIESELSIGGSSYDDREIREELTRLETDKADKPLIFSIEKLGNPVYSDKDGSGWSVQQAENAFGRPYAEIYEAIKKRGVVYGDNNPSLYAFQSMEHDGQLIYCFNVSTADSKTKIEYWLIFSETPETVDDIEVAIVLALGVVDLSYDDTEVKTELAELSAEVSGLSERIDNLPSAESSLFEVVYGETPYNDIIAASKARKHVICYYKNFIYNLTKCQEGYDLKFSCADLEVLTIICKVNGGWSASNAGHEIMINKVKSISDKSTDTQYPSAKAVYDFVNNTLGTIINGDY